MLLEGLQSGKAEQGARRALALDGNPVTRQRMERAGIDVTVYSGQELSIKGDGGPTCLTRPLLRG